MPAGVDEARRIAQANDRILLIYGTHDHDNGSAEVLAALLPDAVLTQVLERTCRLCKAARSWMCSPLFVQLDRLGKARVRVVYRRMTLAADRVDRPNSSKARS